MGADSTLETSDDAGSAASDDAKAMGIGGAPRPPRPARRLASSDRALTPAHGMRAPEPASNTSRGRPESSAHARASGEDVDGAQNGAGSSVKARHGEASEDGDGWSMDEGDELVGESESHKAARVELERSLHQNDDDFDAGTRERLGNLRRGLFDEGDEDQAPPQASSDAPVTPRSNPARDVEPRRAINGTPAARLPSKGPSDAPEDEEPLLKQLSQLRTPTKINPPLGAITEEESWPEPQADEADQSPGVPLSAMDEHEPTVVGSASKDILEMAASQDVNTRVFHAPPELIDLAKRKREERKRDRDRDTVKPDPARLLADRKASAANDAKTPVPEVRLTMSDAAPAVASESAPPVARGVVRHVEAARAEEARREQDSANPRIEVEAGTPESLARAAADWSPQSSDSPAVDSISGFRKSWLTNVVYWGPLVIACALIGYFVYRMITQAP
jgi:hypothetical protein